MPASGIVLSSADGIAPMKLSIMVIASVAAVFSTECSFSGAWAQSRVGFQGEQAECYPLAHANDATISFQATWDGVINGTPRVIKHSEIIYENGVKYERKAPYERWQSSPFALNSNPNADGTPFHSNCRRLRDEVLDGVHTVVIAYTKTFSVPGHQQQYRCIGWVQIPQFLSRKMICTSIGLAEVVDQRQAWTYRTDIKPPIP